MDKCWLSGERKIDICNLSWSREGEENYHDREKGRKKIVIIKRRRGKLSRVRGRGRSLS